MPKKLLSDFETDLQKAFNVKQPKDRLTLLNSLLKKYDIRFCKKMLNGIMGFYKAKGLLINYKESEKAELASEYEQRIREKAIGMAKYAKLELQGAEKEVELQKIPVQLKSHFLGILRSHICLSEILELRQQVSIYLTNAEYKKSKMLGLRGRNLVRDYMEKIKSGSVASRFPQDLNFFMGAVFESEAFTAFIDKRFWEINASDFEKAVKKFEQAIGCYERACETPVDLEILTPVPKAWVALLKFLSSPTFENFEQVIIFLRLAEEYSNVRATFGFAPPIENEKRSERTRRAQKVSLFVRNSVYQHAALNIFEKMRGIVATVESMINRQDTKMLIHDKLKRSLAPEKRLRKYLEHGMVTFDRFIADCEKYLPDILPSVSLVKVKDIYSWCKHAPQKTMNIYLQPLEDFSQKLIQKVSKKYKDMKTIDQDLKTFSENLK